MSPSLGKVLITAKLVSDSAAALQYMRDAGCVIQVETTKWPCDEDWLIEMSRDKAALVFTMEPVSSRLFYAAPHLKVIARPGVGYDTVDIVAANGRGVAVTIAAGANHQSVADFAMGLLLMAARGIGTAANSVSRGGWERVIGTEVWRKTLAIVGLGRIGRAVAMRAVGFDMRVLLVSRHQDLEFASKHGFEFVTLDRALREADFVSLHVPLNAETADLINANTIASMKPGAYLINTSRGGLVDETALAAAVRGGHLAGAAVDVLRQPGANNGSPLIGVPGVIVTPHMASYGREAMDRVAMSVAHSLVGVLRGERPASVINPEIFAKLE
jgi:phosphoglycerate dehydrogenase-like enzyme